MKNSTNALSNLKNIETFLVSGGECDCYCRTANTNSIHNANNIMKTVITSPLFRKLKLVKDEKVCKMECNKIEPSDFKCLKKTEIAHEFSADYTFSSMETISLSEEVFY